MKKFFANNFQCSIFSQLSTRRNKWNSESWLESWILNLKSWILILNPESWIQNSNEKEVSTYFHNSLDKIDKKNVRHDRAPHFLVLLNTEYIRKSCFFGYSFFRDWHTVVFFPSVWLWNNNVLMFLSESD